ncbi:MAG: helix-turn-helix domain-containing protein [Gammaproteobacteria bacterium]
MIRVAIIAIAEALPSSIMGPLDVLRACGRIAQAVSGKPHTAVFDVAIVGETAAAFTGFSGVTLTPDTAIDNGEHYDLVWLPSIALGPDGLFDTHPRLQAWLRQQYQAGAEIAAVCTGAFLLAEAGLLKRQKVTTHWAYAGLFAQRYPDVELLAQLSIVHNERIHCAAAGSAWHDLVLDVIERHCDKRTAIQTAKMFLLQTHPHGQQPVRHLAKPVHHHDAMIEAAQRWLDAHLSEDDLIARVAADIGMNEVTFQRRFRQALQEPANAYIQRLRVEKAKEALEMTANSVEDVSVLVGYKDSSFFRRLFKRLTGLTPAQYRREFALQK